MNGVQTKKMSVFTVTKKGQDITFTSSFDDVNDAIQHVSQHLSYNDFAMNLISRKKRSEKQDAWIHYLATQSVADMNTPVEDGEYLNLVNKMYDFVKNRTRKFHLRLPGVSLQTVNRGQNVGCLYVFDENNQYVGKITQTGHLKADVVSEDVKNILDDAVDNLLTLAKMYGHESGQCSVCGRPLSDKFSIENGIGPVCLKNLQAIF